jgi:hypothetical protein
VDIELGSAGAVGLGVLAAAAFFLLKRRRSCSQAVPGKRGSSGGGHSGDGRGGNREPLLPASPSHGLASGHGNCQSQRGPPPPLPVHPADNDGDAAGAIPTSSTELTTTNTSTTTITTTESSMLLTSEEELDGEPLYSETTGAPINAAARWVQWVCRRGAEGREEASHTVLLRIPAALCGSSLWF